MTNTGVPHRNIHYRQYMTNTPATTGGEHGRFVRFGNKNSFPSDKNCRKVLAFKR